MHWILFAKRTKIVLNVPKWNMGICVSVNLFNIGSVMLKGTLSVEIKVIHASALCVSVTHNLRGITLLKKTFLTHRSIFSGAQMTVERCGNQKVIVPEGPVDHMSHSAAHQMMEKDPQSYSMPKTDTAAQTDELFSIQLLVNNRHMPLVQIKNGRGSQRDEFNSDKWTRQKIFLLYIFFKSMRYQINKIKFKIALY